ncbi:hypothetical protein I2W78_13525 [Streptomyces spinoverrucosus]|uniref:hypothetical protein n=1 Tax=Streptomyces spinoverrucosus TaxID=284043 RepID=UPI0018C41C64|nr:hypothetical protein [Streptomyces spinoverrucosus]MBG0852833.1 hypothetical protein [Streptomyces spinoverrucosus]
MAIAGLSAFGAGISFAGEGDANPPITAVANSSANAVAVGGGYYVQPEAAKPEAKPEEQPEEQKHAEPEEDYGQHGEGE